MHSKISKKVFRLVERKEGSKFFSKITSNYRIANSTTIRLINPANTDFDILV